MKRTIYIFVLLLSVFLVYFLGSKNKIVDNSALGKVKEYSRMMYLSENEMYSKLNQDDFSNEEIIDAMDNVKVSYRTHALRKAYDYYRNDVSKEIVYRLLIEDGFKVEEAQYAIDHIEEFDN